MIVERTREEQARYDFAGALMGFNSNGIGKAMTTHYENRVGSLGNAHPTMGDVKKIMEDSTIYKFGAFFEHYNHWLMFRTTLDILEPRREQVSGWLDDAAAESTLGSLTLNDDVKPPYYYERLDIHTQPGNYHAEYGGFLYHWMIDPFLVYRDTDHQMGQALANGVPKRDYRRILDMGCGIGKSTMPLCDAFPEAEVHGLDYAASMLKYGHRLAESEGKAIHFHQALAEDTGLPDESFDLITAIWLFHEVPKKSMEAIVREAHRLLRPGGVFAIMESPPYKVLNRDYSPLTEFLIDSTGRRMNDPYIPTLFALDREELFRNNGMTNVREEALPNYLTGWNEADSYFFGAFPWWMTLGEKA
jgi:ubiquinone/menaquinone biosynthesis C-methylase UbiE